MDDYGQCFKDREEITDREIKAARPQANLLFPPTQVPSNREFQSSVSAKINELFQRMQE
jgi:hypothetical protein